MIKGVTETDLNFDKVDIPETDDKADVEASSVNVDVAVTVIAADEVKDDVAELIGVKVTEREGNIVGVSVKSVETVGFTVYDTETEELVVESLDFPAETDRILD